MHPCPQLITTRSPAYIYRLTVLIFMVDSIRWGPVFIYIVKLTLLNTIDPGSIQFYNLKLFINLFCIGHNVYSEEFLSITMHNSFVERAHISISRLIDYLPLAIQSPAEHLLPNRKSLIDSAVFENLSAKTHNLFSPL